MRSSADPMSRGVRRTRAQVQRLVGAVALIAVIAAALAWSISNRATRYSGGKPYAQGATVTQNDRPNEPRGCLGGSGRTSTMLVDAQRQAAPTAVGATELAASFVRWLYRFPTPADDEISEVESFIFASTAAPEFTNLQVALRESPNTSNGIVADGTSFHRSTETAVWRIEDTGDARVTVSVGTTYVIASTTAATYRSASTFTLVREQGAWKIEGGSADITTEDLFQTGTPFTGGC